VSRSRTAAPPRLLAVDMTPMIDIVFQLLIFFLVTSHMVEIARARLDLPQERGEDDRSEELSGLVVNLLPDGRITVGDEELSLAAVEALAVRLGSASGAELAARRPLVRADRNAPAGRMNELIAALERAGAKAIRIATSPGGAGGGASP